MYKTILVPLDGSNRSESILPHVISLAERYGSKIILVRVEEPGMLLGRDEVVDFSAYHNAFEQRKKEAELYLENKLRDFINMGFETETHLMFGPVIKSILKAAEQSRADLIAMSSHGLAVFPECFTAVWPPVFFKALTGRC